MKIFVKLDEKIKTQESLLQTASKLCNDENLIYNYDEFLKGLVNREKEISTGIGHGIAFPHASGVFVKTPFVYFIRTIAPIDFKAIDNNLTDLFFVIGTPPNCAQTHLKVLSILSKKLQDLDFRYMLRTQVSKDIVQKEIDKLFLPKIVVVVDSEQTKYTLITTFSNKCEFIFFTPSEYVDTFSTRNADLLISMKDNVTTNFICERNIDKVINLIENKINNL